MRCCVPGCGQESEKEISFHRFPVRDPNRSQLWINKIYAFLEMHNCERGRLKQKKQSVLCSKHFLNSDYLVTASGRMLKISACPSVFSYDPNALKRRNRQSKSSSEIPVSHRLHYIFPKEIGELEGTKVMVTECEEENKKNVSCTQESALEEFMIKKATVKEPMIKESTIEEPILKKAKVEKPMLEDMVEAPMLDQGTNACTRCLSLEKEVQRLQESIASLEKVVQLQSCSVRDISSPRQEELLQGSNTPTTTTRLAHHDHRYASTPRSLRRKLDFSHAQKIMMEKTARYTMKKFRRLMITVSQLKNLLKSMKEEMIARPEVVDHLEQVFGGSPLQLYKRCVQVNAAGGKRVTKKYSTTLRAFALTLHFYSPRAYAFVREEFGLNLPHPSTLRSWYNEVKDDPGFTDESFSALKMKVNEYSSIGKSLYCSLMLDDMHIKKQVEWDGNKFHGFCTMHKNDTEECHVATQALVLWLKAT
nr:PREDICTED: uncharacterized protein LOC105670330 [Linepithema humile]